VQSSSLFESGVHNPGFLGHLRTQVLASGTWPGELVNRRNTSIRVASRPRSALIPALDPQEFLAQVS
jgi:hypothetical protein